MKHSDEAKIKVAPSGKERADWEEKKIPIGKKESKETCSSQVGLSVEQKRSLIAEFITVIHSGTPKLRKTFKKYFRTANSPEMPFGRKCKTLKND